MSIRTLALTAGLAFVCSTAQAQMQIVQQMRTITGTTNVQSGPGGSQQDSFAHSAPDAGPFTHNDMANASVMWAGANTTATQNSQLSATRIGATGAATAYAFAGWIDAVAGASGESRVEVTFDVPTSGSYHLTGSIAGTQGTLPSVS